MKRTNLLALTLLLLLCAVSQGAFKFVAWSDNRPYDPANRARFVWMLQQMNLIVKGDVPIPLFHVVPGDYDLTSITEADIAEWSLIQTWYLVPGNHDPERLSESNSAKDLPETDPQARFLFLNEYQCPAGTHDCSLGRVCPDALDWLEIECQLAPPGYPIFVVGHEPAFPENRHTSDSLNLYPEERDAFWDLLVQYGATYICGHTHYYSTYSSDGATQIDVGNAGALGESNQTFVVFEVDGSNVSYTAYRIDYNVSVSPKASNPNPENGAENVPVDTVLSWIAGIDAVSHDVYFGTTDSPTFIQNQLGTTYGPAAMNYETTYYWRIDEFDGSNIHTGDLWSFTTEILVPELPWSDGFESGSFAAGGWTTSGNASVSSKADYSGIYGAEIKGTAWIEKAVSTVGFSNINVTYVSSTKGLDSDEYLYVEWYDGSAWNRLEATQDTAWSSQDNSVCGPGADDNAAFKLRFRTNASNSAEYAYVDDVEISCTSSEPVHDHDVAVMAITAPTSVIAGGTATIDVTVENQGMFEETFNVTLTDTPPLDGTAGAVTVSPQTITLGSGGSTTVSFSWDTADATLGDHTLDATAVPVTGETDTADNSMSTTSTVTEAGATIHVESIEMSLLQTGKNWKAVAKIVISPTQAGATVVGDWYLKGSVIQTGATGVTDGGGYTEITSPPKKAKSGDIFKFVVTDVILSGYVYDPGQGVTEGSDTVP